LLKRTWIASVLHPMLLGLFKPPAFNHAAAQSSRNHL
jgi:hypothetical protein